MCTLEGDLMCTSSRTLLSTFKSRALLPVIELNLGVCITVHILLFAALQSRYFKQQPNICGTAEQVFQQPNICAEPAPARNMHIHFSLVLPLHVLCS